MDLQEFEKIKDLIKKAEIESAKNQGIIESIEIKWKEDNVDNIEQAEKKLEEMKDNKDKLMQRREKLFTELQNSYDWDKLENDL